MKGRDVIPLLLGLLTAASPAVAAPPATGGDVLARLRDREGRIQDLSGVYRFQRDISDEYAVAYAEAMDMTPDAVRERFAGWTDFTFALRNPNGLGERLLEQATYGSLGQRRTHSIMAYDGKQTYDIPYVPQADERRVADVTLGRDVAARFDRECDFAILMGLCLPDCTGPLSSCASARGGTFSDPIQVDGATCVELRLNCPEQQGMPSGRYVIVLDEGRGLAPRAIRLEYLDAESGRWSPVLRWEVQDYRRDDQRGICYPSRARRVESTLAGMPVATSLLETKALSINQGLRAHSFTPAIEDGSNVYDERTNRGYVSGRKPSRRILRFLDQSAEEARREVAEARSNSTYEVPAVRVSRSGYLVVAAGLLVLVAATAWQWNLRRR